MFRMILICDVVFGLVLHDWLGEWSLLSLEQHKDACFDDTCCLCYFYGGEVWSLLALQMQQDGSDGTSWPCKLLSPTSVCVEPVNLQDGFG